MHVQRGLYPQAGENWFFYAQSTDVGTVYKQIYNTSVALNDMGGDRKEKNLKQLLRRPIIKLEKREFPCSQW